MCREAILSNAFDIRHLCKHLIVFLRCLQESIMAQWSQESSEPINLSMTSGGTLLMWPAGWTAQECWIRYRSEIQPEDVQKWTIDVGFLRFASLLCLELHQQRFPWLILNVWPADSDSDFLSKKELSSTACKIIFDQKHELQYIRLYAPDFFLLLFTYTDTQRTRQQLYLK